MSGWFGPPVHRAMLPALALLAIAGCARATQPPGGPVPEAPPAVIAATPDTFAVIEPFDGPVRIEFERRISERPTTGSMRDAVLVSPRTGDVTVRHRGDRIEVHMEGGFRERTVYRITLLPVLQDLYRNRLDRPYELFFSTGPEFEPNLVAGMLTDRLTGEEFADVRVDAVPGEGGPVHSAVSDSTGVFAFRFLPAGEWRIVAYEDRNRNREPDFEEPRAETAVSFAPGDTVVVTEMALLAPDTTAAVVESARALDSLAVTVTFDDYLDAEEPLEGVVATLTREDGAAPTVAEILHAWEWDERVAAARAVAEPEADPDVPDPALPDPDLPAPDAPDSPDEAEPDAPPLPDRRIVLVLAEPLEPEASYVVTVENVRNLHGIPGGGGETEFEAPPAPEPEPDPDREPGLPGPPGAR